MNVLNRTPYSHRTVVIYGARGRELLIVLLKATFRLSSGGREPLPEPLPIFLADQRFASGATRYPSDVVAKKLGTDVLCHGTIYAPGGSATPTCDAELRIGELAQKVRAFGRRTWQREGTIWRPSAPEPFTTVSLGFERAFGGSGCAANPLGMGSWQTSPEGIDLPQIEDPEALLCGPDDRPAPAGFGAVAAHWAPRIRFAGTYDDAWTRTRAPLYPDDFDDRFFHVANAGMTTAAPLVGGEPIVLINVTDASRLETELPRVHVRVQVDSAWLRPALDLVVIEPNDDRIALTYRATLDVTGRLDRLPHVRIIERRLIPLRGELRA